MEIALISIFITALSMSFSHCIGMCGGIVIAYSSAKIHKDTGKIYQVFSHILYNLGRMTSYVTIGILSAFIGYKISVSMHTKGVLFIIIGIFLILFAFLYVFFPKIISYIEPSIPKNPKNILTLFLKKIFIYLMASQSLSSFYGLGILNGFLPCGMVYFFASYTLTASTPLMGGVMMGVFGLATFLPMFILGFIAGNISASSFRNIFLKISLILMLFFGGSSIYKGISILQGKSHTMNHQMKVHGMQNQSIADHKMDME